MKATRPYSSSTCTDKHKTVQRRNRQHQTDKRTKSKMSKNGTTPLGNKGITYKPFKKGIVSKGGGKKRKKKKSCQISRCRISSK